MFSKLIFLNRFFYQNTILLLILFPSHCSLLFLDSNIIRTTWSQQVTKFLQCVISLTAHLFHSFLVHIFSWALYFQVFEKYFNMGNFPLYIFQNLFSFFVYCMHYLSKCVTSSSVHCHLIKAVRWDLWLCSSFTKSILDSYSRSCVDLTVQLHIFSLSIFSNLLKYYSGDLHYRLLETF